MKILVVDDEQFMIDELCECIREVAPEAELVSFQQAADALAYVKKNKIDVVFLDIQMGGMDGMEFARQLKLIQPDINIIFCTGYSDYIYDAVSVIRCSGYLLKPVSADQVARELENLRNPVDRKLDDEKKIVVQCFGNFEVFVNGIPLAFELAKAKELLAYLIDRKGAVCSNREIAAVLWEDDADHTSYLKKCKRILGNTLKEAACEEMIHSQWGGMSVVPDQFVCDYYEWEKGTAEGINAYKGQYMNQYGWAEITNGYLSNEKIK